LKRIDEEVVLRGLAKSRNEAKNLILEGKVLINGRKAVKPSELVSEKDKIEILEESKYVSRGGLKLEFALKEFKIEIKDKVALDVGASTGGFTDCLLKHGAIKVYAVDVGKGIIDLSLRNNPKVILIEDFNARYLSKEQVPESVDIVTIDVSFISILKILPAVIPLIKDDASIISLIKPQFESERQFLRKGIIKDMEAHKLILKKLKEELKNINLVVVDATYSPIKGGKGNIEFFFHIKKSGNFVTNDFLDKIVEEVWNKTEWKR